MPPSRALSLIAFLMLFGCGGAKAPPSETAGGATGEARAEVRPPDEPSPASPTEPAPSGSGDLPEVPELTAEAAAAPPSPSLSERLAALAGEPGCLEGEPEAIVVLGRVLGASLLLPSASHQEVPPNTYVLLPVGSAPRPLLAPSGGLLRADRASELGISGAALLAAVREDPALASCQRPTVGLASVRRLDASGDLPIDVGATLEGLLRHFQARQPGREVLGQRAARLLAERYPPRPPPSARGQGARGQGAEDRDEEEPDPRWRRGGGYGTVAAMPTLRAATGPHGALFYTLRWSPRARQLTIHLIVRQYDDRSVERANPDPYAGSVNCHAPPGADCAPRCIPPGLRVTTRYTAEAGVRAVYDARGQLLSLTSESPGVLPPEVLDRTPIGSCN